MNRILYLSIVFCVTAILMFNAIVGYIVKS